MECQCGGGPDIDDKKSPGDPDLISGREKLHGCQMVKKERVCPTCYGVGASFFSFCTTIISSLYMCAVCCVLAERPQEDAKMRTKEGRTKNGRGETSEDREGTGLC